jgi:Domain of unknown function (DUF1992)
VDSLAVGTSIALTVSRMPRRMPGKNKTSDYNQGGGQRGRAFSRRPPIRTSAMSPFDIEDQIQKAQQDGKFDNLRGQGKPFSHLDTDALEQLVREQGFRPHFVELDAEIRAKVEIARQAVRRTYEWVMQARGGGSVDRQYAQDEWRKALSIFDQRLTEINKLIKMFNLELPEALRHRQKFSLKRDEELQKMGLTMSLD